MRFLRSAAAAALLSIAAFAGGQTHPFHTKAGGALPEAIAAKLPDAQAPATFIAFVKTDGEMGMRMLARLDEFVFEPMAAKGAKFLVVCADSDDATAASLLSAKKIDAAVAGDAKRELFKGVANDGFPRLMIAGPGGKILWQHTGWKDGREAEIRMLVQKALDGKLQPGDGNVAAAAQESGEKNIVGQQAPKFEVDEWVNPAPAADGKFVLVDVWATWCGPCRKALETAEKIHGRFDGKLVTMAISDEDRGKVDAYVKKAGLKQPIGIDRDRTLYKELGIRGIPHAYLVDPAGKVVWQGHPMELWGNNGAKMDALLNP